MTTGFVYDPRFLQHDNGQAGLVVPVSDLVEAEPHVARPELISKTKSLLDRTGLTARMASIPPCMATEDDIAAYHTREYIQRVKDICASGGGDAGAFAPLSPASFEVALLSAGGGMAAVDAVMEGRVHNAYALLRPPGHHAVADMGMGFCIFNNVVVAARHAQRKYGLERILILDWDVHHGNGTQAAFYGESSVLYASLHQDNCFPPDSGKVEEVGTGEGRGYTVNVPLPAGTGVEGYLYALSQVVIPIARQYRPELILVSAGQDPNGFDPLARMLMFAEGFRAMARVVKGVAEEVCQGRLVVMHEGGYSTAYVPFCTLAVVEELTGATEVVTDPFAFIFEALPEQKLLPWHANAVERAVEVQRAFWTL